MRAPQLCFEGYMLTRICLLAPGAIIRDGDRKAKDASGPMIWDNFSILEQIAPSWRHISALIHARVVGSRVDVVTLCDEMVRAGRFTCRFFTAIAGNKADKKNQSSSMNFNALI